MDTSLTRHFAHFSTSPGFFWCTDTSDPGHFGMCPDTSAQDILALVPKFGTILAGLDSLVVRA